MRQTHCSLGRTVLPAAARAADQAGRRRCCRSSGRIESPVNRLRRAMSVLDLDAPDRYAAYHTQLIGLDRDQLYTADYRRTLFETGGPRGHPRALAGVDRHATSSTACSTSIRGPTSPTTSWQRWTSPRWLTRWRGGHRLLDHEFMEFAASLPSSDKLSGRAYKVGLKDAARGWVPDEILDAPKRGFRLPIHDWLRTDLRDYATGCPARSGSDRSRAFQPRLRRATAQRARRSAGPTIPRASGRCSCTSYGTITSGEAPREISRGRPDDTSKGISTCARSYRPRTSAHAGAPPVAPPRALVLGCHIDRLDMPQTLARCEDLIAGVSSRSTWPSTPASS